MDPCLVAGLGNPGRRYEGTRHNLGFLVVDLLAQRLRVALQPAPGPALAGRTRDGGVVLLQPQTYMNNSGEAIGPTLERYGITPERLLVVVDDVALPLGALRMRPGGSDGGHNGLASVIGLLGTTDIPRLRLGIAGSVPPAGEDMAPFVLSPFAEEEREQVRAMVARAADACLAFAAAGISAAMNRFNTAAPTTGPFAAES